MSLFKRFIPKPDPLTRSSCNGCSSCFSKPIETMPSNFQAKLELIRGELIEARDDYKKGIMKSALIKSKEVKLLIKEISSLGDFKNEIDSMFAAHVPEPDIQQFIAGA
ncbi:MAG: hypothetical protein AABX38_03950 [Candidatus Micrarchaeota archaeon]